jgi:hypothetical protein
MRKEIKKYFELHPTHNFGNEPFVIKEATVLTPDQQGVFSELFFRQWKNTEVFVEVCWNNSNIEAVFIDGYLIWTAHK